MFWEIFLNLCFKVGKSPNAAAKELKISSGSVTNWKNGTIPNNAALLKIANYFGVSVDYLLGKEPDTDTDPAGDPRVGIMKKLNTLTPDQVKAAEQYIDFLASQTQNQ